MALPANVELLGKQPQADLAAFAANWDVALIPFKPDRLAAGADPIKTYEYLAMGLPVVVTGVYPPTGGEAFVARAEGVEELLREIERAAPRQEPGEIAARRAFAATCTWDHRLEALLAALAEGRQRVAEKRALLGLSGDARHEGPVRLQVPDPGRRRGRAARPSRRAGHRGDRGARLVLPRLRRPLDLPRPRGPPPRRPRRGVPPLRAPGAVRPAQLDRHRGGAPRLQRRRRADRGW